MNTREMLTVIRSTEDHNRQNIANFNREREVSTMKNEPAIIVDKTTTWHAIGKSVEECRNVEQVLEASGLDYTVKKFPVYFSRDWNGEATEDIPNRFVTVRTSDMHPYDVVSDKFEIIQNRDAFDFVNYMGDDLQFEKAGETATGMVYIIARLPEVDILGDGFVPHVIFRNGFSGKVKITAAICPLRVVCQNQFNFAFKDATNTVNVRHVQNAERKLEEAREVLRLSADYMERLSHMASFYAQKKLSPKALEWVLDMMFPIKDRESMNAYAIHRLEEQRGRFTAAYNADDNGNFRGTAWGMINAYTDFLTHQDAMGNTSTKEEGKFVRTTFGQPMNRIVDLMDQYVAA